MELYALIYELNADATRIPGTAPIAATFVPLTSCPRATTWQGKTFRSTDFAYLTIPFTGVSLSAGKFYGVYFAGKGVPGTAPIGSGSALEKAKQATTTTTTSTTTTSTTTPWSAFKSQQNSIPKTATTLSRNTATTLAPTLMPTMTTPPSSLGVNTAISAMLPADEGNFVLKSNTPLTCVGASYFIIAIKVGSCSMSVAKRSNGIVVQTVRTRVAVSGAVGGDIVKIPDPTIVYFANGTSTFRSSATRAIADAAATAKNARAVFVGGFTGNTSKDKANQIRLAQGRAVKTRAALRDAGVSATITIWTYGRTGAVSSGKTEAEQNQNRRAVVYIVP